MKEKQVEMPYVEIKAAVTGYLISVNISTRDRERMNIREIENKLIPL